MKKRLLLTAPVVLGVLLVLCAGTVKVSKTFQRKEEKIITNILTKIDEYEIYLAKLIEMISSKYGVDDILWLKKSNYSI